MFHDSRGTFEVMALVTDATSKLAGRAIVRRKVVKCLTHVVQSELGPSRLRGTCLGDD